MNMGKIKSAAKGIAAALIGGTVGTLGLSVILFLLGAITNGFKLSEGFVWVRTGILIATALLLLIVAGMILTKKYSKEFENHEKWKSYFGNLNLAWVMIVATLPMIIMATIADYIVYFRA